MFLFCYFVAILHLKELYLMSLASQEARKLCCVRPGRQLYVIFFKSVI